MGSGPYIVRDYVGGERITLVPNPAYNGPAPARLQQIEFIVAPEDGSRMALLETGDVDIVERVPPEAIPAIQALRNAEVLFLPSMFSINMELVMRGPLADARVRRALNISVDRDGITRSVLGGLGIPRSAWWDPARRTTCAAHSIRCRSIPSGPRRCFARRATAPASCR